MPMIRNLRKIEAVPADAIFKREPELLREAFDNMPSILVHEADVLIVDRIGKNYSGTGVNPNIFGTWSSTVGKGGLKVKRTCFFDLQTALMEMPMAWGLPI